jgi:hypothetical protein
LKIGTRERERENLSMLLNGKHDNISYPTIGCNILKHTSYFHTQIN